MIKYLYVIFIIGCIISCNSYTNMYDGSAILVPKHKYIPIYDKTLKSQLDSIINDTINENYMLISIKGVQGTFAKIEYQGAIQDTTKCNGWIELKFLGINPAVTDSLKLYSKPNANSSTLNIVEQPFWGDLYQILGCTGKWLYIKTIEKNKIKEGWMNPDDQCDNPYTTCN